MPLRSSRRTPKVTLLEGTGVKSTTTLVGLGFTGVDVQATAVAVQQLIRKSCASGSVLKLV